MTPTRMSCEDEEFLLQKLCRRNISESMPAALDRCSTPPLDLCTTIEDLNQRRKWAQAYFMFPTRNVNSATPAFAPESDGSLARLADEAEPSLQVVTRNKVSLGEHVDQSFVAFMFGNCVRYLQSKWQVSLLNQ